MANWLERPLARILIAIFGALLLLIYGLMLIPVAVNLPVSWPGLVYAAVGIAGGVCSFAFLWSRRLLLLVPFVAAIFMTAVWSFMMLYFGEAIDQQLQSTRRSSGSVPPSSCGGRGSGATIPAAR